MSDIGLSKVFVASGIVAIGSGLVYIIYQQYILIQRESRLENQLNHLSQKLAKLEKELKKIKESLGSTSSAEETEEIFVDASEVVPLHIAGDTRDNLKSDDIYCDGVKTFDEGHTASILAQVDRLLDEGAYENLTEASNLISGLIEKSPNESEFQWRLARVCFLLASEEMFNNPEQPTSGQSDLMKTAHQAASRAIELNEKSGDAHKWMAIVIGSVTQFQPIQEQIKNAYKIKEHIQLAIQYKPKDFLPYHILGRWCYTVYMLNWVERRVVSTLYATPLTATLDEVFENLLKAEELSPHTSIDNALYLGKAYLAKKDYEKAVMWWKIGEQMKASKRDVRFACYTDFKALKEIQDLLSQYESYCQSL